MTNLEAAEAIRAATSKLYEITNDTLLSSLSPAQAWVELRKIGEAIEAIHKNEKTEVACLSG